MTLKLTCDLSPERLSFRQSHDTGVVQLSGLIVPFGVEVRRYGVTFTFEKGSLRLRGNTADVKLLVQHDDERPVGYAVDLAETDDGWHGTFALPDVPASTAAADEAALLLRDGFSIGAMPSDEFADELMAAAWSDNPPDTPLVFDGELLETSLVSIPQFNQARVNQSPRQLITLSTKEDTAMPTTLTPAGGVTVDLDGLHARFDAQDARFDAIEARLLDSVTEPPPAPLDVPAAFAQLVTRYGRDRTKLALDDMLSSENTGLTSTARTSAEVIDYIDARRYMLGQVGMVPFPETGIVHTFPKKTRRTTVGAGTGEKTEAPSQTPQTSTVTFTGAWYKGALDIPYELIRTSSPGAVGVAVEDMLDEAAVHSEATFVAAAEAAATATGAAIDFTDYGTFVGSVRPVVATLRKQTGLNQPKVALTEASFTSLLSLTDGDNRRILASSGGVNADGSSLLTSQEVNVAGVTFFESPESSVDLAFNVKSLRKSELPPQQLAADNVALIGRDVGILGNIMCLPLYPTAVLAFTV